MRTAEATRSRELEDVAFGSFGLESKGEVRVVLKSGEIAVQIG